ncbi:MAG TPA: DUF2334 domain-containing protein [Terriglobales bacterium]|nr:DUF2334 domain-containing protein [Terriglobales bacterium]
MAALAFGKRWYLRVTARPLPLGLAPDRREDLQRRVLRDRLRRSRILVNVNIDDFAPYCSSDGSIDLGGDPHDGLTRELQALLKDFPALRLTLFVIPDLRLASFSRQPSAGIADGRNAQWLNHYRAWSEEGRVELAAHGLHHLQTENRLFQRHIEFAFKTGSEANTAVRKAAAIFLRAGLPVTGFRPPGWGLNCDLSLLRVIAESGFAYLAGSSLDGGLNHGRQRVSNYFPTLIGGVLNLPQNVLLDWPKSQLFGTVDRIIRARGMVSIKAHTRWNGSPNQLTAPALAKLRWLLAAIAQRYGDAIQYATLYDIAMMVSRQLQSQPAVGA